MKLLLSQENTIHEPLIERKKIIPLSFPLNQFISIPGCKFDASISVPFSGNINDSFILRGKLNNLYPVLSFPFELK
jgi:hypothetical protein